MRFSRPRGPARSKLRITSVSPALFVDEIDSPAPDWSGEIDAQTKATIDGEAVAPGQHVGPSPFSQPGVHRELVDGDAEEWDLNMENVDK